MTQLPEKSYLTEDPLAVGLIVKYIIHLFNGNPLSCGQLDCLCNLAIAARSKELFTFIILANFPVLKLVLLVATKSWN